MKKKANTSTSLQKTTNGNNDIIEIGFEVSIYRNGELLEHSLEEAEKIQSALREDMKMSHRSVMDMTKIMIKKGWTQERFAKSYEHVLENCTFYPPKPAEFLSFDRKVRFNTYNEICDKINEYVAVYYKGIHSPVYITKQEQQEFDWVLWDEKYRIKPKEYTRDELEAMSNKQDEYIRGLNGKRKIKED